MSVTDIVVNDEHFKHALDRYVATTSKNAVTAINGKCRDVMLRAAKFSPMMQGGASAKARGINSVRAVAVTRLTRRGILPTKENMAVEMRRVAKAAKGYMKSAFVKAGNAFPKNEASAIHPPPMSAARHRGTVGKGWLATANNMQAGAMGSWQALDGADKPQKQKIADDAFNEAKAFVLNDMLQYLAKKTQAAARMVSGR